MTYMATRMRRGSGVLLVLWALRTSRAVWQRIKSAA